MDQDHVVLLWASPPVPLSNLLMVVTPLIGRPATSAQLILSRFTRLTHSNCGVDKWNGSMDTVVCGAWWTR